MKKKDIESIAKKLGKNCAIGLGELIETLNELSEETDYYDAYRAVLKKGYLSVYESDILDSIKKDQSSSYYETIIYIVNEHPDRDCAFKVLDLINEL